MEKSKLYDKVVEFESKPLSIQLLRDGAQLIFEIEVINECGLSCDEIKKLVSRIDTNVKIKFQKLNPDFSDAVLSEIVKSMHYNNIYLPKDITVVDDTVFVTLDKVNYHGTAIDDTITQATGNGFNNIVNAINEYKKDPYCQKTTIPVYDMTRNKEVVNELILLIVSKINQLMMDKFHQTAIYHFKEENKTIIETSIPNVSIFINKPLYVLFYRYVNSMPLEFELIIKDRGNYYKFRIAQVFELSDVRWEITEQPIDEIWQLSNHVKNHNTGRASYQVKPIGEQDV